MVTGSIEFVTRLGDTSYIYRNNSYFQMACVRSRQMIQFRPLTDKTINIPNGRIGGFILTLLLHAQTMEQLKEHCIRLIII